MAFEEYSGILEAESVMTLFSVVRDLVADFPPPTHRPHLAAEGENMFVEIISAVRGKAIRHRRLNLRVRPNSAEGGPPIPEEVVLPDASYLVGFLSMLEVGYRQGIVFDRPLNDSGLPLLGWTETVAALKAGAPRDAPCPLDQIDFPRLRSPERPSIVSLIEAIDTALPDFRMSATGFDYVIEGVKDLLESTFTEDPFDDDTAKITIRSLTVDVEISVEAAPTSCISAMPSEGISGDTVGLRLKVMLPTHDSRCLLHLLWINFPPTTLTMADSATTSADARYVP